MEGMKEADADNIEECLHILYDAIDKEKFIRPEAMAAAWFLLVMLAEPYNEERFRLFEKQIAYWMRERELYFRGDK